MGRRWLSAFVALSPDVELVAEYERPLKKEKHMFMSHDLDTFFFFAFPANVRMNQLIIRISFPVVYFFPLSMILPFYPLALASVAMRMLEAVLPRCSLSSPSRNLHNTLALTVLSLRGLDIYHMWYRLILSEGEQPDPLLTAVDLESGLLVGLRGYSGPYTGLHPESRIQSGLL
jgi:hypothetical protein